jgi:hypothetical protein
MIAYAPRPGQIFVTALPEYWLVTAVDHADDRVHFVILHSVHARFAGKASWYTLSRWHNLSHSEI